MSRVVIIGGGVAGLSLAYNLASQGQTDVVILERHRITAGSSWHAAGTVAALQSTPELTELVKVADQVFPRLERETGLSTGYRKTGGYVLASSDDGQTELNRLADRGLAAALTLRTLSVDELSAEVPLLNTSGLTGGLHVAQDGTVNPVDLCMAYAKGARTKGVEIRHSSAVTRITTALGRVTGVLLADGGHITAETVVLAAGVWSGPLAETVGLSLPLQPMAHTYLVSEASPQFSEFPMVRIPDLGLLCKSEAGRLLTGGFAPGAPAWDPQGPDADQAFLELPEDWDRLESFAETWLAFIPHLAELGTRRVMTGPEGFTPDTLPLMGECPGIAGLFVSAGYNGRGVMVSAGAGQALASWIRSGQRPVGLAPCDIARFDPKAGAPGAEGGRAAMAAHDQPPDRLPPLGRRSLPLAQFWTDAGARFGPSKGWTLPQSYQGDDIPAEASTMARGTALLDRSALTELRITGPDAERFLSDLTCGDHARPPSEVSRTYLLNHKGGIEAEAVITTLAEDRFAVTAAASARWSLQRWLSQVSPGYGVTIADLTAETCVLAVMGAGATQHLTQLVDGGWQDFPLGTYRDILFGGGAFRATRLSILGENGWEISAKAPLARDIATALLGAGAQPMGDRALNGCRIEKGHARWGVDLSADHTPLQIPFGPKINWSKPFLGHGALERRKHAGQAKRLVLMALSGSARARPQDPVMEGSTPVGAVTSVAMGPRTGQQLAMGWVRTEPFETLADTAERRFDLRCGDGVLAARALTEAAFDPKGARLAA